MYKIELLWDVLQIVPYLGLSATKDRVTFHISQLQLQIKRGHQLCVQSILQFESSEEETWGRGSDLRAFFVVVALLFYVHGKHLRSCRDDQLT